MKAPMLFLLLFCIWSHPAIGSPCAAFGSPGYGITGSSGISRSPEEGTIQAGAFRIKYMEQGTGEPLILLHAGVQNRHMWDTQIAAFSRRYRVITFDLPGHGETAGADTVTLITEVINTLMDSLKMPRASFIGVSFGSTCVTEFVLAHPQRVNKLVLVSPGLLKATDLLPADSLSMNLFNRIDSASVAGDHIRFARYFTDTWCIGPFRDSNSVSPTVRNYIYNTTLANRYAHDRDDWRPFGKTPAAPKLSAIQQPVLVIAGDKDVPYILSIARYIHQQVKQSRLWIMKDVAHMLNMEKPADFNKEVLRFLKQP
jgi:pimeloyl-ACP methyl ester carboxylesterase